MAVMGDAIEQRRRHLGVAEHPTNSAKDAKDRLVVTISEVFS
jgi:hypothetical protein